MNPSRLVLVCSDCLSSRAVYHALRGRFERVAVIVEQPASRSRFLKRRVKRLGAARVLGQLAFVSLVARPLRAYSQRRAQDLMERYQLSNEPIVGPDVHHVESINGDPARALLKSISPALVIVNGTRIIGKKTLGACEATFINTHHGITPLYRGVHGGYWALAEGRPDLVGTTIHYVDKGIDTGDIIQQVFFDVSEEDNFATYPLLHMGEALPALLDVVEGILDRGDTPEPVAATLPSKLRTHPTLLEYASAWLRHGAK